MIGSHADERAIRVGVMAGATVSSVRVQGLAEEWEGLPGAATHHSVATALPFAHLVPADRM